MANQSRQVSIFINGREVNNTLKSIAAEQKKVSNELATMTRGTDEYEAKFKELKSLNGILTEHREGLRGISQGLTLGKIGLDKFVGVAAGAFAVDAVLNYGKAAFSNATSLELMGKKAQKVFGEYLPLVTKEAEKNAAAMGLTNAQYLAAAAGIQDLLVPMGFQRDTAAGISTQLVNLSGALAEWSNGERSAKEVTEILQAALLGERDALKGLGIDLQQAQIDAELAARGLSKLTGNAKQQAEASITLDLILQKSQDAQKAYAEGSGSMARQSAELTAKFQEVYDKVSTLLIPVFQGLLTIADPVIGALGDIAGSVVDLINAASGTEAKQNITDLSKAYDELTAAVDQSNKMQFRASDAYEESRAGSVQLTTDSQELAKVTAKIGALLPQVVEQWDDNGKAILINSEALKKYIEDQKKAAAAEKAAADAAAAAAAKKAAYAKDADKRAKEAAKLIEDEKALAEKVKQYRLDLLSQQSNDEIQIAIRNVEKKYDAEIKKAVELEKKGVKDATVQRIALEEIKGEEIAFVIRKIAEKARDEQEKKAYETAKAVAQKELDAAIETEKFKEERDASRKKAQEDIKAFEQEGTLTEQEQQLAQLDTQYLALLAQADEFGVDSVAITAAYERQKADIVKKSAEERLQYEKDLADAQRDVEIEKYNAIAEGAGLVRGLLDESNAISKALFVVEKTAAIASVIISLQKEKAAILAAARLGTPFDPTGIAALTLAAPQLAKANIRAGISVATIGATAIKAFVPQKFDGGYYDVIGQTDKRNYRARGIGTPVTGLLPNFPVLFQSGATGGPVLASERGREYFVANKDLANPRVASYVAMIDNITRGRSVAQFATGGINPTTATLPSAPAQDQMMIREFTNSIATLNAILAKMLNNGVVAIVPDKTTVDIFDRFNTINNASGGFYE